MLLPASAKYRLLVPRSIVTCASGALASRARLQRSEGNVLPARPVPYSVTVKSTISVVLQLGVPRSVCEIPVPGTSPRNRLRGSQLLR